MTTNGGGERHDTSPEHRDLRAKELHAAFAGLVADGRTTPRGAPRNPLQLGATFWHFRHESRVTSPPTGARNLMLPPLWALAKVFGVHPYYDPLGQPDPRLKEHTAEPDRPVRRVSVRHGPGADPPRPCGVGWRPTFWWLLASRRGLRAKAGRPQADAATRGRRHRPREHICRRAKPPRAARAPRYRGRSPRSAHRDRLRHSSLR